MISRLVWLGVICWIGSGVEFVMAHFAKYIPFEPVEAISMMKFSSFIIFLFGSILFITGLVKMKRTP